MNQTVIAKRTRFEKRLFTAEIFILIFAFAILLADVLLMVFYYKKANVSTIVMSILFLLIIFVCIFQIALFIRCNKADENAILFDQYNNVFHLNLYSKSVDLKKEDIKNIQVKDSFVGKANKNVKYGGIIIETKDKSYSIGFLLEYKEAAKEMEKILRKQ